MSTIDLSAGLMAGLPQRVLRLGESNFPVNQIPAVAGLLGANNNGNVNGGVGVMMLMTGTPPASLAEIPLLSSRISDRLVIFHANSAHFAASHSDVNPAVISTIYVPAIASGTATWFRHTVTTGGYYISNDEVYHQFYGTVGTTGSGADLEMTSTTIVQGTQYRILNLRLQFPNSWVY